MFVQEENVALSEDLSVMVKENQLVSGQLGQSAEQIDDLRQDLHQLQSNNGVLTQTLKAREMELEDLRTAYEDLAAEDRQHQSSIGQLKRQLGGQSVELEAAKQEVMHLQEAQHSMQMQMQQYVIDIQALERNSDSLARELQSAKNEAEDVSRDRNRVLEQLQAVQVCTSQKAALDIVLIAEGVTNSNGNDNDGKQSRGCLFLLAQVSDQGYERKLYCRGTLKKLHL
jgi:chromosome segregation ATPase